MELKSSFFVDKLADLILYDDVTPLYTVYGLCINVHMFPTSFEKKEIGACDSG